MARPTRWMMFAVLAMLPYVTASCDSAALQANQAQVDAQQQQIEQMQHQIAELKSQGYSAAAYYRSRFL